MGAFGAVRAAVYKPKNGEPQVECAVKYLKTGTNDKVCNTEIVTIVAQSYFTCACM